MTPAIEWPTRVRAARPDDAAAILAILGEIAREDIAFATRPEEVDTQPTKTAKRIRARSGRRGAVFVAEHAHRIVGFLEARTESPSRRSHGAELLLAVTAAHRRRGIARALLQASQTWAHAHGVEVLRVTVRVGNSAALQLYADAGFIEDSRTTRAIKLGPGRYEDAVVLSRWLD
jgi:ribosomal protein S18 acetylase RimI-like enzyme